VSALVDAHSDVATGAPDAVRSRARACAAGGSPAVRTGDADAVLEAATAGRRESIPKGLIAYVSFGGDCDLSTIVRAAKGLLNAPFLTRGVWGDGSKTLSLIALARQEHSKSDRMESSGENDGCSGKRENTDSAIATNGSDKTAKAGLMIVPQAALFSKMKGTKELHYHRQLDKEKAKNLYCAFVKALKSEMQVALIPGEADRRAKLGIQAKMESGPTNPSMMFRTGSCAGSFQKYDEKGLRSPA